MNKLKQQRNEAKQRHADHYLSILMESENVPRVDVINVAIAVERLIDGDVTSKYNTVDVENKWIKS